MKIVRYPYVCDECGKSISPESKGMVEWIDDGEIKDVRIVHFGTCFKHTNHYHRQDHHLETVLSNQNMMDKLGIKIVGSK